MMMMGWMACVAIMVFGAGGADTCERWGNEYPKYGIIVENRMEKFSLRTWISTFDPFVNEISQYE